MWHTMIGTHGFKFSVRQNYPHPHNPMQTTQSPKSPNQKRRTPGPQRHGCNVILLKSINRSPYYLIIILTFNYLLPETFYIGIFFFFWLQIYAQKQYYLHQFHHPK